MILISLLLVFAHIVCLYFRQHVHELPAASKWHLYSVLSWDKFKQKPFFFFLFTNYHYVFIIAQLHWIKTINKCPKNIRCVHFCAATGSQNCCKERLLAEEQLALLRWGKTNVRAREGKTAKSWRRGLYLPLKRCQLLFITVTLSFQILFDHLTNVEWAKSLPSYFLFFGGLSLPPGKETRLGNPYILLLLDNSNGQNVKLRVKEVSYVVLSVALLSSKLSHLLASKPISKSLVLPRQHAVPVNRLGPNFENSFELTLSWGKV